MPQNKSLCTDIHICHMCRLETKCDTYTWACPWRNDDEDQMCDSCMKKFAESYEEFENEQVSP